MTEPIGVPSAIKNIFVNLFRIARKRFRDFRAAPAKTKYLTYSNFILPVIFFYYEIVFRLSTTGHLFRFSFFLTLLFSLCYGMIGYFLTTITKKPRWNHIIKLLLIIITAVPFLVEYFVFRKFNALYDLNTVKGGAGDVAGGFMGDVVRMVFSLSGLFHIFLFLLPLILYAVFGRHFDPARGSNARRRFKTLVMLILTYLLTLLLLCIPTTYHNTYSLQYNFEGATTNFGLMTGLRLEIKHAIFGKNTSFELNASAEQTASSAVEASNVSSLEESSVSEETVDFGVSSMDIDFAALAKDASSTYAAIDEYVASLTPSSKNQYTGLFKGKNLIMISAEAFSAEVIDPDLTPTLYRLATKGINFTDYYQPEIAGTTGGEYHNIFGMLSSNGGTSMEDAVENYNPFIMSQQLNQLGYYGIAYHDNDYTYYSRDYTHNRLGYSEGFIGYGNGMEEYVDRSWPESDLQMMQGTVSQYIGHQPFNVYYMTVSGHSDYNTTDNMMSYKNWDKVKDLDYSDPVKAYLAANLELEYAMEYLVEQLEQAGIADDTVIVLGADHFPYGLDDDGALGELKYLSELYGYDVKTYLERDHNRLIIWSGCLEDDDPIIVDTPTCSIDILPTLLNLFGLEWDSRLLPGRDVFSDAEAIAFNDHYDWKTEKGTYISATDTFTPANPGETVSTEYISRIQSIVRNKVSYCDSVLDTDNFAQVFGKE